MAMDSGRTFETVKGSVRWEACGPQAVLVTFGGGNGSEMCSVAASYLNTNHFPEVVEATPAFERLLIEFRCPSARETTLDSILEAFQTLTVPSPGSTRCHTIPVEYHGADLERVANHTGLSVTEIVQRHTSPHYHVALLGFSPGFPYLEGLDPALATPRLTSPRTIIPAGSVGIGGTHTGIYSVATPGGWNLIGCTQVKIFDPSQSGEDAFLFRVGDRVTFVAS